MTTHKYTDTLKAASDTLREVADNLKDRHSINGRWRESSAKAHARHDQIVKLVGDLQRMSDDLDARPEDTPTETNDELRHWWAISFRGSNRLSGDYCDACTFIGYPDQQLTIKRINEAKQHAGVTDNSVLIAATYMGCMTSTELDD